MKKILLLIFPMAIAFTAHAQVEFGIKAGYNHSNFIYSGSGLGDIGSRINFNAGIFASIPFSKHFFLQPELEYSGQGIGATDSIAENIYNNYLNVPVLIKYQHQSGLFAESGPQLGFLLSSQLETAPMYTDSKNSTKSTDFSWVFGLGYKIPSVNLGIDFRYNLGLTNVAKNNYYQGSAKNAVFQLDLFYQFKQM
jgi:Outer membrane protein beta-barrel domain